MQKDDKGKGLHGLRKPGQGTPQPPATPTSKGNTPPPSKGEQSGESLADKMRAALNRPAAKPTPPPQQPEPGSSLRDKMRAGINRPTPPPAPEPPTPSVADKMNAALNRPPARPGQPSQSQPAKPITPPARPGQPSQPQSAKPVTPPAQPPAAAAPPPRQPAPPTARPAAPPSQPNTPAARPVPGKGRLGRPMPKPTVAAPVAAAAVTAAVAPEIQRKVTELQRRYNSLQSDSQLGSVYESIGRLDTRLTEIPFTLDGLRSRGYVHAGQLETRLAALNQQWEGTRPRVEAALQDYVNRLGGDMNAVSRQMTLLNPNNAATFSSAETAVTGMQNKVSSSQRNIEGLYNGLLSSLTDIENQLRQAEWMIQQFDESPEVNLREAEGPLMAVKAEWQPNGKEGPDGILFLTDQRLMFEQKEEITTKKFLGIFKKESEKLQGLQLEIAARDIESVKDSEEGGFLGMGKKDILEFVFAASAPVSRARFHLKGQDSKDWAVMIRRVLSGDIDKDRASGYVDAVTGIDAIAAAFPSECPNCYAQVETPPRGVTSLVCEFCGATIQPIAQ